MNQTNTRRQTRSVVRERSWRSGDCDPGEAGAHREGAELLAGASNQLETALLVNPHDIDGMARTIALALSMPLTERRIRWEAMMAKLHGGTIQQWFADFVDALQGTRSDKAKPAPAMPEPSASWALRSVNSGARYH